MTNDNHLDNLTVIGTSGYGSDFSSDQKIRRFTKVKYKLICYGCGKATSEGYHVLIDGTILHYCSDCLEDVEAARENEEIRAIEKF